MGNPAEFFQMLFEQVNDKSPTYRFRTVFYNVREPGKSLNDYRMPPHTPAALLRQATEGNPDPDRLVPVLCEGFNGLRERVKAQHQQLDRQQQTAAGLAQSLKGLTTRHSNDLLPRLDASKRRFEQARARLVRLVIVLERVRAQGYALQGREDELRVRLEQLLRDLSQPDEYRARLAELQTRVLAVGDVDANSSAYYAGGNGEQGVLQLERADAAQLSQTLEDQRKAHAALVQVLLDDERGVDRLARALSS